MFKNYVKFAWRNLLKDRQFSLLNLIGLSTGLACAFLILLWISDERSVDNFQKNGDRLYQVMENSPITDGGVSTMEHTPDLLGRALVREVPEIEDAVTIKFPDEDDNPKGILSVGEASLKARELFVTPNFFTVFSFRLLDGNKDQVFSDKHNVLLSDETAMKLFHSTKDVIGKTIIWDRGSGASKAFNGKYTVSGIFEAPSSNSSIQFDLLFPHELYVANTSDDINWQSNSPDTYVLLKKGVDVRQLRNKIKDFIKSRYKPGSEDLKWTGTLFLQRFTDKYLHNHYENGEVAGGRIAYVQLFSIIALFILVIACINFMNLATAKASQRIKEVGIKKVIGASRASLIFQFLSESMLMTLGSLVFAILIVFALLPGFRELTGKELRMDLESGLLVALAGIALFTGLLAGSYPALYLSGFRPARALKGRLHAAAGESWIRKGLVIFQFAISMVLIVSVGIVYKQMELIQTRNLGYNKDNIIHFANEGKLEQNQQAFLAELRAVPGVVSASDMEGDMLGNHSGGGGIDWPGKTQRIEFSGLYVDYDFMETMGLRMKEGRMFSRKFDSDSSSIIFNETAIAAMRLKDPLGKIVKLWGRRAQIIGVVKDFHYESLYNKVGPFFLGFRKNVSNNLVKIKAGMEKETLLQVEKLYKTFNPGLPFEYNFLDEDYKELYASEQRVAILSRWFAGIAVIISCLGLFGLATFTAQKRQKEIGIRKIVGASIRQIVILLSTGFLKLVFIAVFVAFPIAWWTMAFWLSTFAYRVQMGPGIFLMAAGVMLFITLLTISFQAIRAAIENPVKSLAAD
jgi:putative ABC transport system permease protein